MSKEVKELVVKWSSDTQSYEAGVNRNVAANAKLFESENKIKKNIGGLIGDFSNVTSGMDAASVVAGRVGEVFKTGLFGGVAIQVGLKLAEAFGEINEEAKTLNKTLQEGLSESGSKTASVMGEMTEQAKKLKGAMDAASADKEKYSGGFFDANNQSGLFHPAGMIAAANAKIRGNLTPAEMADQNEQGIAATLAMQQRVDRRDNKTIRDAGRGADVSELRAGGDSTQADELQRQYQFEKELQDARRKGGEELEEQVKRRQDAELAGIKKAREDRGWERDSQYRILEAQRIGDDQSVNIAKEKYRYAQQQLADEKDPERKKDLSMSVFAAKTELDNAAHTKSIKDANNRLAIEAAGVQGEADKRRMTVLQMEKDNIEAHLRDADTTGDERTQAELALKIKQTEIAEQQKTLDLKALSSKSAGLDQKAGFGPAEELKLAKAKLDITRQQLELEKQSKNFDQSKVDALETQIAEGGRMIQQREAQKKIEDDQYATSGKVLDVESSTRSEASKRYEITKLQLEASKREADTLRGLSPELARNADLRTRGLQHDLQAQDEGANLGQSERNVRQRLHSEKLSERKLQKFRKKREGDSGLINVKRDMNGDVIEGTNPVTGEKETRESKDNLDPGEQEQGKIDTKPRLGEANKRATDEFRKQFEKGEDSKNRKASAPKVPNANDTPEVGQLKEVNKNLDEIKKKVGIK